ncbi:MAG: hypothetical protein C0507_17305 [Cyanobacteria bacterium PR.3.49]|nr:hypothetical protein [Cyanobacteria bacterium PR.3.49]
MWTSGKFAIERKKGGGVDPQQEKEAIAALRALIPEKSKEVYSDLQTRRGAETGRWLKELSTEVPHDKSTEVWQQAQTSAQDDFESVRIWMDALFQEFAGLTYGFNENAVGGDLFVSTERPTVFETRDDTVWYKPVSKNFQGRLATRFWSLAVKGDEKRIAIFLFPNEMVLGFKTGDHGDDELPPILVAEPARISGRASWKIQGEEAAISMMGPLAKELFGDLIRVASGKMEQSELFNSHKVGAPKLGENVAVGFEGAAHEAVGAEAHPARNINIDGYSMSDACDILDKVIDRELQRIYKDAAAAQPGTPQAASSRKQISAIEAFRMKVVDAFQNYSHESHAIEAEQEKMAASSAK